MTNDPSTQLHSEPKERPGGRSERIGSAVVEATIGLLMERGVEHLSFEQIATAAGINRTTLYRRWGSKERLLTWALLEYQRENIPQPDTGSLEGDLVQLAQSLSKELAGPSGPMFLNVLTANRQNDPAVGEAIKSFWDERSALTNQLLDRALARGELDADVDRRLLLEMVFGTSYFRLLQTGKAPTDKATKALVQQVLRGFRQR